MSNEDEDLKIFEKLANNLNLNGKDKFINDYLHEGCIFFKKLHMLDKINLTSTNKYTNEIIHESDLHLSTILASHLFTYNHNYELDLKRLNKIVELTKKNLKILDSIYTSQKLDEENIKNIINGDGEHERKN